MGTSFLACTPISDTGDDPPAAVKPTMSFSATAVVSSMQLEMSSSFAISTIGAVIRLATEAAPTKTEAEASPGYVSLAIAAGSPRKFSISQHYGSNFADGLTLADVLTADSQYKLYLFFETGTIPSETIVEGATLNNDVIALPFTTATLPPAGDSVWNNAWTNNQFVGSLLEWGYSENQKGVFVTYIKSNIDFTTAALSSRTTDNVWLQGLGSFTLGSIVPKSGFLFNILKIGGSYPDTDNYYYIVSADDTRKIVGTAFQLEITDGLTIVRTLGTLTRYSSP
ncbi:hypothetical protein P0082_10040 [Candidatus Haliotispira prima]|uniref:DUF4374 domain-containing protein n=1 Tax=Candidatus Haliotispira prima TaxID=3034016 RepID=A0ABY8MI16_9SPIO|nr:hypothetical protein P0082_10040 [Candidatus Haliotispira prima]